MRNIKIKISDCRNRYHWYYLEAQKKNKDKDTFEASKCESEKGVIISAKGFVYHEDYKTVK